MPDSTPNHGKLKYRQSEVSELMKRIIRAKEIIKEKTNTMNFEK